MEYSRMTRYNLSIRILILCQLYNIISTEDVKCDIPFPFYCSDKSCIKRVQFCDGVPDCPDGEDEIIYNRTLHKYSEGIECKFRSNESNNTCLLPNDYMCDHELDCIGGRDECGCESSFECGTGDCAVKIQFCDGNQDCSNGMDELIYEKGKGFQCRVTKKHQTISCVLPDVHVCDGDSECSWGTDECFCDFSEGTRNGTFIENAYSNDKCFRCLDGSLVIPINHVCDGIIHCKDLSDECLCGQSKQGKRIAEFCESVCMGSDCNCPGQLHCKPKLFSSGEEVARDICIPPESICDDKFDCDNEFDESFCALDTETFACKDKRKKIKKNLVCDGVSDCDDNSDEDQCHETMYICQMYKQYFPNLTGWDNPETYPRLNRTVIEERFKRYNHAWPYYTEPCDGTPLCANMDDECNNTVCGDDRPGFCDFSDNEMRCPNSRSILVGYEVCDGQPTCNDTAPETSADEKGCEGRFYCSNHGATRLPIHIPMENRCDGKQECDDQSDEIGCNTDGNITHFYCNDGGSTVFIPIAQKCDKRRDCKGGSDECDNCETSPFSSDEKLIKSRVLIVFLWIIGLLSTLGNTAIIIHQIVMLAKMRKGANEVAIKNRILVLNLAGADLLVGIYLIVLGIKDATVEKYCLLDQEWRSSDTCSALGAVAVIGTEASVLILLIMTSYRLYLVYQPFQQQKMRTIIFAIIFAWIAAIIMGLAPLAFSAQEYFLSCVWFRTHRYLGYACKSQILEFTRKLIAFEGPGKQFSSVVGSDYTWGNMLAAQTHLNSTYVPERFFGYYSAHSVCLPRLFPNRADDRSWGYSLLLVLLNFFAFLFILLSYLVIYRRTTKTRVTASSSEDRAAVLQRKVTRIVLTDFCCWMPICIMAFIRVAGVDLEHSVYSVTAIILLPINSAMNPFLYSSLLDIIWDHMMPARVWFNNTSVGKQFQERGASFRRNSNIKSITMMTNIQQSSSEENPENMEDHSDLRKNGNSSM